MTESKQKLRAPDTPSHEPTGRGLGVWQSSACSETNPQELSSSDYDISGKNEPLETELILSELGDTRPLLQRLEILNSVDSTNTYLLEKAPGDETYAVFAEQQLKGRGQFNRPWIVRPGKSIALSILWYLSEDAHKLTGLSLVMGLAIVRALEAYGLRNIKLKWPNDVMFQEKKLAGILIETRTSKAGLAAVIGIGLNLYKPTDNPGTIDQAVTDVYSIHSLPVQRNRLAGLLLRSSIQVLSEFQAQGLASFLAPLKHLDSLNNQLIHIKTAHGEQIGGTARGINIHGQLCVKVRGKIRCFNSGEVRVTMRNQKFRNPTPITGRPSKPANP